MIQVRTTYLYASASYVDVCATHLMTVAAKARHAGVRNDRGSVEQLKAVALRQENFSAKDEALIGWKGVGVRSVGAGPHRRDGTGNRKEWGSILSDLSSPVYSGSAVHKRRYCNRSLFTWPYGCHQWPWIRCSALQRNLVQSN